MKSTTLVIMAAGMGSRSEGALSSWSQWDLTEKLLWIILNL